MKKLQIDILIGLIETKIKEHPKATINQQEEYCETIISNLPDCTVSGLVISNYAQNKVQNGVLDTRKVLLMYIKHYRHELITPFENQATASESEKKRYFIAFGFVDEIRFDVPFTFSGVFFKRSDIESTFREMTSINSGKLVFTGFHELTKSEFEIYNQK